MKEKIFDEERAKKYAEILKAVGHPVRLRLVDILANHGDRTVSELSEILGVPQAIVSQQLRILRLNGLVKATRKGGNAFYSNAEPHLRDLLDCLRSCRLM